MVRIAITSERWKDLDGEPILVKQFIPVATIENNKVRAKPWIPYAIVSIVSPKLSARTDLPISHRVDFVHLWEAFNIRKIADNEEVLIHWSRHHHRGLLGLFKMFLPHIHLMICPKGSYEKMSDPNWWRSGGGEQQFLSIAPIQEWKPIDLQAHRRRGA